MDKLKGIFLFTVFAALNITAYAQISYKANITALPQSKTIDIYDISDQKSHQNAEVKNGKANISGTKAEQTILMIIDRENSLFGSLVVDGSEVDITLKTDGYDVKGDSKLNQTMANIQNELAAAKDDDERELKIMHDAFYSNRDNIVGAFIFANGYMYQMDYEQLKAEVESGAKFLEYPICARAKQYVKNLELRAPGSMFKDIEEADTLGVSHKLSEYVGLGKKGSYVLIDFWASWCGQCMAEMPNVKANHEKYKEKGFNIVGLSFDQNADRWKKAIRDNKLDWVHLSDLKYWQTIAGQTYGIQSIPSSILCDPNGKIIAIDLRGEKLGQKLMEIYGF